MNEITYLSEYGVLVCRKCRFGIYPTQVNGHLLKEHKDISKKERGEVMAWIEELNDVAWDVEDVRYPEKSSKAIGALIVRHGIACRWKRDGREICSYVAGGWIVMKKHLRSKHDWRERRRKNRVLAEQPWEDNIQWQMFYTQGRGRKGFEVERPVEEREEREEMEEREVREMLLKKMNEKEKVVKKKLVDGNLGEKLERDEVNPWLQGVRWIEYMENVDMKNLRRWIRGVGEAGRKTYEQSCRDLRHEGLEVETDEESEVDDDTDEDEVRRKEEAREERRKADERDELALEICCGELKKLFYAVMQLCAGRRVEETVLRYVNQKEMGEKNSYKPFRSDLLMETVERYASYWVHMMCFIWRSEQDEVMRRPKYELNEAEDRGLRQLRRICHEVARRGRQVNRLDSEKVRDGLTAFWMSCMDRPCDGDARKSVWLCAVVSLGVYEGRVGWRSALEVGTRLSATIKFTRGLIIYVSYEEWMAEVVMLQKEEGMHEDEARHEVESVFSRVKGRADRMLTLTSVRSEHAGRGMSLILLWRMYAMTVGMNSFVEDKLVMKGEDVLIGNARLNLRGVMGMVWSLIDDCRRLMLMDLLFVNPEDEDEIRKLGLMVDMTALHDEWGNAKEWYSFVDADVNRDRRGGLFEGRTWMVTRIVANQELRRRFLEGEMERETWRRVAVTKYFRDVTRWKEMMVILVHLSGGGPGRGNELLSVKRRNGIFGHGMRGIYMEDGLISMVTRYHKGYSANFKEKVVIRYLPKRVSRLMLWYLWLVVPFVEGLQHEVMEQEEMGEYMWESRPKDRMLNTSFNDDYGLSDDELGEEEEEEEEGGEGGEDEMNRTEMDERSEMTMEEDGLDDEDRLEHEKWRVDRVARLEERAERRRIRNRQRHCREVDRYWTVSRLTDRLRQESEHRMGSKVGMRAWRDVYVVIHREGCRHRLRIARDLERIYDHRAKQTMTEEERVDDMRSRQLAHSRALENRVYGMSRLDSRLVTIEDREMFRRVSEDWHEMLGLSEEEVGGAVTRLVKKEDSTWDMIYSQLNERERRRLKMKGHGWLTAFRAMMKDEMIEFRGLQARCLEKIGNGTREMLVIMPTGGGKSLLWMLPALLSEDGVTVVVVPLLSLMSDIGTRCGAVGLGCLRWGQGSWRPSMRVVLVAPEGMKGGRFTTFLNWLEAEDRLDRIVVDECHELLGTLEGAWRLDYLRLKDVRLRTVPMLYLTGTLPPRMEWIWCNLMGIDREDLEIERDRTGRHNLRYSVYEYERGEREGVIRELVEVRLARYGPQAKAMIFCESIAEVKELGLLLKAHTYYRDVGTRVGKDKIMLDFMHGEGKVLVGTNAIGLGIDCKTVRMVVHARMRGRMLNFVQESGRAGRGGEVSESVVMRQVWKAQGRVSHRETVRRKEMDVEVNEYLDEQRCRRLTMAWVMDGTKRRGCRRDGETNEVRCDRCDARWQDEKRRREEERKEDERGREEFGRLSMETEGATGGREEEDEVDVHDEESMDEEVTQAERPAWRREEEEEEKDKCEENTDEGEGREDDVDEEESEDVDEEESEEEDEEEEEEKNKTETQDDRSHRKRGHERGNTAVEVQIRNKITQERMQGDFENKMMHAMNRAQWQERKMMKLRTLRDALQGLSACFVCVLRREVDLPPRHWTQCERHGGMMNERVKVVTARMYKLRHERPQWMENTGCYTCGFPRNMCAAFTVDGLGRTRQQSGVKCEGRLTDLVAWVLGTMLAAGPRERREMWRWWRARVNEEAEDWSEDEWAFGLREADRDWLLGKHRWMIPDGDGRMWRGDEEEAEVALTADRLGVSLLPYVIETNGLCTVLWRWRGIWQDVLNLD